VATNDNDLELMRRIAELFTAWPFLGSRRMAKMLQGEGRVINRKRIRWLMRKMGIIMRGQSRFDDYDLGALGLLLGTVFGLALLASM
jgi:hypothetical protein